MSAAPDLTFLIESLYNDGVGKMRVHLMNEIARRGYRVELLLAEMDSPYLSKVDASIPRQGLRSVHGLKGLPGLALYLRRSRPRVLLTQRVRLNLLALRARALSRTDTRVFVTVNVNMSAKFDHQSARKRDRQIDHMRTYYPRNDGIIAVSRGVADDAAALIGIASDRVTVIPNPTVTPELATLAAQPLDHPWFAPDQAPVLLGAGRLMIEKGFDTLIRAFALVRRDVPTCRLMILGEGPDRKALETLAAELGLAESVAMPGFANNPYAYMTRASAFVLSSTREGSPNALVEALAVGVPLVSTDCPNGPQEVLEGGKHGRLVPVGDAAALARAIVDTLRDPVGTKDSRMAAAQRYTVERSTTLYLQALGLA
ncbi:glycosyltransferase involved in cell wall biosynthesis [Panacagrimonas perspica]|uniref:Glycosyltransferase involved in cell wall biosynthesis n=1 Tax=Panacagrimonas perspica TaxID=381431 RepID=A0A4S3K8Z4_9GAMM|nr:glycosyltransferase [Panacagrimonas perspica]TDU24334.1 glycosyltransferase involved in cell wall biosynthesis [Panacagrimonas perspica]THD04726.1 hypothetical protein B1810_04790 [Panacagrimonas perspica]